MAELIINDSNYQDFLAGGIHTDGRMTGLHPRNFWAHPFGSLIFAKPFSLPLIPESEWAGRLQSRIAANAQLSDIRNISGPNGGKIPSRDQGQRGYCVPKGTLIELIEGSIKPIELITKSDEVVTAEGNKGFVEQLHQKEYEGDLVVISLAQTTRRYSKLKLTPNHSVLTQNRGYVPSGELSIDDTISFQGQWTKDFFLDKESFRGKVYNIGVTKDNSYIASGIGVHNCWAHSPVSAMLLARAIMGQPYQDLSAYSVACIIKNFRDEGGWNSEAVDYIGANGVATSDTWPQQSIDRRCVEQSQVPRQNYKYIEWQELDPRNMKAQLVTCLLMGIPIATDHNFWSHSICTMELVSLSPFRTRIWNSWGDSWSENGTGLLEGSKAVPDNATACIVTTAAA